MRNILSLHYFYYITIKWILFNHMYIFLISKNTNSSLLGRFRSFFGEITKHINKIILMFFSVLVCCCIVFVHICCNAYMLLTRLLPEHAWRQTLMSIWNNLLAAEKLFRQLVNVIEVGGFYGNDTFYTKLSLFSLAVC